MAKTDKNIKCSFCGKSQDAVERIIAGPGVFICDECIKICTNILEDDSCEDTDFHYTLNQENDKLPSPLEIKKVLDSYVIRTRGRKKNISSSGI